jgi:hypothetical protein
MPSSSGGAQAVDAKRDDIAHSVTFAPEPEGAEQAVNKQDGSTHVHAVSVPDSRSTSLGSSSTQQLAVEFEHRIPTGALASGASGQVPEPGAPRARGRRRALAHRCQEPAATTKRSTSRLPDKGQSESPGHVSTLLCKQEGDWAYA